MKKPLLLVIVFIFLVPNLGFARNTFLESLNQRQEVKKKTRWTLADWMATKEKIRLMDLWLAANTSEQLFEFMLGYNQVNFDRSFSDNSSATPAEATYAGYQAKIFISLLGVGYEANENSDEDKENSALTVYLRLLGAADQSTNLTIHYGQETVEDSQYSESYKSSYFGASIRLYLFSVFGIYGMYRDIQDSELPLNAGNFEGSQTEYGAFIDLGPFQITGNVYSREIEQAASSNLNEEGVKLGLSFYF